MLPTIKEKSRLVGKNCADEIHIVDLTAARVDSLEQFVDLFVTHLLAQVCKDVPKLPDANEASHVFVKYLKSTAVFFGLARISEATGSVEDFAEGIEIDCRFVRKLSRGMYY